jgi:protein-disulfide isomerase
VAELTSAAVPPIGADDHLTGAGEEAILYLDLCCPHCAAAWPRIRGLPLRLCFRHFPIAAKRPRAPALHAAAEAAGRQGAFWEMVDSLFAERGRVDDPHLWGRVERFGLDLERFEADRRSEVVAARVRRDFESGVRAGVAGTPAAYARGELIGLQVERALEALATEPARTAHERARGGSR